MKKLVVTALLLVGITSFAQEKITKEERTGKGVEMEKLSPEQKNQLELKQLTLELDLTAAQQKQMASIIADENAKKAAVREEMKTKKADAKKLTADERFAMKNKMLDEKIAQKEKVKKVLTPQQLEKWEKMKKHKRGEFNRNVKKKEFKKVEKK